jgi:acetaldehyde dehydrogenase/alcohol dehydrogenase
VLRYNAEVPTKFMPAPGYSAYVAPERYALLGWVIGLGGHTEAERRERLFRKVDDLLDQVSIPRSLAEAGVAEAEFEASLPDLAQAAFEDPSLRTNPRMPLVRELEGLLRAAWRGR